MDKHLIKTLKDYIKSRLDSLGNVDTSRFDESYYIEFGAEAELRGVLKYLRMVEKELAK